MGIIQININENIFIKDPDTSELGKSIITESIILMGDIGFEAFTFKKLANRIRSTEASIYRYFENKHKLLLYLVSWYWNWLEYQIMLRTLNLEDPEECLRRIIGLFAEPVQMDPNFNHINEAALQQLVVVESYKAYQHKEVDAENKLGLFESYKRVAEVVVGFIEKINPEYRYPRALVSTMIESLHHQMFFAAHLPRLTEFKKEEAKDLHTFMEEMVFRTIKPHGRS